MTTPSLKRNRHILILILVLFVMIALAYSVINPLHEATDELRHYRFVRTIAITGRLPVQGQEPCRSQSHHPPLFYAIGALATSWIDTGGDICPNPPENPFWAYRYWDVGTDNKNQYLHGPDEDFPWYGEALAAHIIRAVNVLVGAGVVLLTWATGKTIWPHRPSLALGGAALVAFNPMFLYMAGAINNDIIAALSGAAVLYACVRLLRDPDGLSWRWGLILGLLYGLALLSKFNLAAILLLIEAAITWVAWRKNQWRQWFVVNLFLVFAAILIAGWWFVRNQMLYGEPTGFQAVTELWGARDPRTSFGLAVSELPYAWTTLWGRFGYGQIPLPKSIYNGLAILTIAALSGAVIGFFQTKSTNRRFMLLILTGSVFLFLAVLFNYMLVSPAGPNGRFFFPALSALSLLLFFGLDRWLLFATFRGRPRVLDPSATEKVITPRRAQKTAKVFSLGTIAAMVLLALFVLFGYLAPAYAKPVTLPKSASIPNPVEAQFDNLVTLLGYELSAETLQPADSLDIDLYWQVNGQPPGDYLLFVHLLDESGAMVAQRDTHPGLGNFPSSRWQPGDRFVESIRLYVPETAYTPAALKLNIGLYAPGAYRLAIKDDEGQFIGDSLNLATLQLAPNSGDFPNSQDQVFGGSVQLVGYEYDRHQVSPGENLEVTLYWHALDDAPPDYLIQVRLLGQDGQSLASADGRPGGDHHPQIAGLLVKLLKILTS